MYVADFSFCKKIQIVLELPAVYICTLPNISKKLIQRLPIWKPLFYLVPQDVHRFVNIYMV